MSGRSFRTGSGRRIEAAKPIDSGAAGAAIEVKGDPGLALKVLAVPTGADEQRAKAMLSLSVPPRVPGVAAVIAWPTDLVFGADRKFAGFLMPRAPEPAPVNLSILAQRRERETKLTENFAWNGLLAIARNYVVAIEALHASSVIACDINLKNVMVSGDQTVTVIDCDSMQFEVGGKQHLSSYHQIEFLAPEFSGVDLRKVPRTFESDRWSLAVLLWMVLMDGHHPLTGVWSGSGEPDIGDHAAAGRFPYAGGNGKLRPSREAPPWRALPAELQRLFIRTFTEGARNPGLRATASDWSQALRTAGRRLQLCKGSRQHYYPSTEPSCPWCEYEEYLRGPSKPRKPRRSGATPAPKATPRPPVVPPPTPLPKATPRPVPPFRPTPAPAPTASSSGFAAKLTFGALALIVFVVLVATLASSDGDSAQSGGGGGGGSVGGGDGGGPSGTLAPVRSIRAHYRALDDGRYGHSYALMAPTYRHDHHRWISQMKSAVSRINLIRVGPARIQGDSAWVPILFFARDTYETLHSDTICRRFEGRVHMVRTSEGWRYDPADGLEASESSAAMCP
jgi:DNA-binding helix-hairpin-helix protein with protein kinase domain